MQPHSPQLRPRSSRRRSASPRSFASLIALAVAGVWMAWQAGRVNTMDPVAPLPDVPPSALMGSIATLPSKTEPLKVRMSAPTPSEMEASVDGRVEDSTVSVP